MMFSDLQSMVETMPSTTENTVKHEFTGELGDLWDATTKAFYEGDMVPLIKQELKFKIQERRMAAGKRELKVNFPEPKKEPVSV